MRLDEETTITRAEIEEYNRYVRYVHTWCQDFEICKICGEFKPPGYRCAYCGADNSSLEENEDGED